jgi:hypothetical protein
MKVISVLLNAIHIIYMFAPFIIPLIPKLHLIKARVPLKFIFLVYILTPLHWHLFDNKCILTLLSIKTGDYKGLNDKSWAFTDVYMRPIYEPLLKMVGLTWNLTNKIKITYVHWILIFIVLWYVVCFKLN